MNTDASLRQHLRRLLAWEDAHVSFDTAVDGIPEDARGSTAPSLPHSPWQIVEHLRRTQRDILDFCTDSAYSEPPMSEYWPRSVAPEGSDDWERSVRSFRDDRERFAHLVVDGAVDLFARIPHGTGQTYLREVVLLADHTAYHVGQLVLVRRALGVWPS
jgi:hypothetical protein